MQNLFYVYVLVVCSEIDSATRACEYNWMLIYGCDHSGHVELTQSFSAFFTFRGKIIEGK